MEHNHKIKYSVFEPFASKYKLDLKSFALPKLDEAKFRRASMAATPTKTDLAIQLLEGVYNSTANENLEKLYAFSAQDIEETPRLCTQVFMSKPELTELLKMRNFKEIKRVLYKKVSCGLLTGPAKVALVDLMYSVAKFCFKSKFNVNQTGSVLGMFYSTHRYFCGSFNVTPDELYEHFSKCLLIHTVVCPPDSFKYFTIEESRKVITYFCGTYLRFLPLIRLLCLPNFAIAVNYPPEPVPPKEKRSKDKGKDKKKGKKGKKDKKKRA